MLLQTVFYFFSQNHWVCWTERVYPASYQSVQRKAVVVLNEINLNQKKDAF